MTHPAYYRIRQFLPSTDERALPHLLDVRPQRMEIEYKHLKTEAQTQNIDYYGLWVQKNVYRTVSRTTGGDRHYVDLITKGNYSYVWDAKTGLPTIQNLSVYYCLSDGSFDRKFEVYPRYLVTAKEQNAVVKRRRSLVRDTMVSRAIALGIGEYLIPFFKKYALLMANYIDSGDTELIETISAIEYDFVNTENNWMFTFVPRSESILAGLTQEQKDFIKIAKGVEQLTIKQVLLLNFWMALRIPSAREIANYLEVAGGATFWEHS